MELGEPDDLDDGFFRSPPPPDDRLWRHPSELVTADRSGGRGPWASTLVAGLTGSVLTVGLLAVTGILDGDTVERPVTTREAIQAAVGPRGSGTSDMVRAIAAASPAIVRIEVEGDEAGVGSGVIFRDDGLAVTNAHVIDEASRITVVLSDGRVRAARTVGADTETDVAVIAIEGDGPFVTALLGASDNLQVGSTAIAIGSPLGLEGASSVTTGVISALGRAIETQDGRKLQDMIQTDAAIAAGSSGGALLDPGGAVVGITTAFAVTDLGAEGLGFATPIELVRAVADELVAHGKVRPVWFGVRGKGSDDPPGVRVDEVMRDAPAADAGLREGDVIVSVDGRDVLSMPSLRAALKRRHPGDAVAVIYLRGDERRTAEVTLAERAGA